MGHGFERNLFLLTLTAVIIIIIIITRSNQRLISAFEVQ